MSGVNHRNSTFWTHTIRAASEVRNTRPLPKQTTRCFQLDRPIAGPTNVCCCLKRSATDRLICDTTHWKWEAVTRQNRPLMASRVTFMSDAFTVAEWLPNGHCPWPRRLSHAESRTIQQSCWLLLRQNKESRPSYSWCRLLGQNHVVANIGRARFYTSVLHS